MTRTRIASPGRVRLACLVFVLALVGLVLMGTAPAHAAFGIKSFDGAVTDQNGNTVTQAGSHPYEASTTIEFNTHSTAHSGDLPDDNVKDIRVDLPPGLIGDPSATPKCTHDQLESTGGFCPPATQVGVVKLYLATATNTVPVYNMVPPVGEPAQFGFYYLHVFTYIDPTVRTGSDYGLTMTVSNVSQGQPILGTKLTFWGVPADPSHDAERSCHGVSPCSTGSPPKPFLTLPTSCTGPVATTLSVDSWQDPGAFKTASFLSHDNAGVPVGGSGCDRLDFSPSIALKPDTSVADSPAGLSVDLKVPQDDNPDGLAEANLRKAVVTLPRGVSVSPAAADGLAGCSLSQIALRSASTPTCPDGSKIGSVTVHTPLLPDPLTGAIYLAQQNANPFHSLLAIYVVAQGSGVTVKLAGHVVPDPQAGQLTATFDDNPQLPFDDLMLDFFGGPRGALVTPASCGTFASHSVLSPWSATAPVASDDSFAISQNCGAAQGFSPSLSAGVENAAAGGHSPFTLTVSRDQGENVAGMDVTLPKGLLAALKGVKICPDSEAATGACPAGSKIGHVTVAAGAGSHPLYVPQAGKAPTAVYLAGPYKGGPYSLVIKVPAQAGPFDLGTVAVRAALYVDPETAQVTVKSDPMPQILKGIPLRYRKVNVVVDRKDFMRSPTNCRPAKVRATAHGAPLGGPVKVTPGGLGVAAATDALAHLVNRFQVGGCGSLPFKPRMSMRLQGKRQRRDGGHPGLVATVREPKGQANIRNVRVALPLSIALDPKNSRHVCDYDKAKAVHGTKAPCPRSTIIGRAVAKTPLLPHKLRGRVYLVQGIRFNKEGERIKTLPTLLVPLRGKDHVAIDLRAKTNVSHKKLVTTFRNVPDAQISSFKLHVFGASKKHPNGGLLVVTHNQNICRGAQVTDTTYRGQSGARYTDRVHMKAPCKGVKKARRIHRLRRAAHRAARHGHKARARKAIRRIHKLRHANNH